MNTRSIVRGAFAALVLAAAACGTDAPDAPGAAGASGGASGAAPAAAEAASAPSDSCRPVTRSSSSPPSSPLILSELMAEPGAYTGTLVNNGTIEHDITFENGATVGRGNGETVEFEFEVPEDRVSATGARSRATKTQGWSE